MPKAVVEIIVLILFYLNYEIILVFSLFVKAAWNTVHGIPLLFK